MQMFLSFWLQRNFPLMFAMRARPLLALTQQANWSSPSELMWQRTPRLQAYPSATVKSREE
jgi:hypothetical protein